MSSFTSDFEVRDNDDWVQDWSDYSNSPGTNTFGHDFMDELPVPIKDKEEGNERIVPRLTEICSRVIGQTVPFELVQRHPQPIPEDLQKRIAYWSFPLEEERLLGYAEMMGASKFIIRTFSGEHGRGVQYSELVINITQMGMCLAGTVKVGFQPSYVSIQFDRGCITSTKCTCSDSKWCEHVIALCIARIRGSVPFEVHPPLSETLGYFNRDQLQKVIQCFVEKFPIPILWMNPVTEIIHQLKDKESDLSMQCGAPDLTAGGFVDEVPRWQISDKAVCDALYQSWETLIHHVKSKEKILDICYFEKFAFFLHNHDENVVTAFRWGNDKMKEYAEECNHEKSNQLYLILMQGLEVLLCDPFVSKSSKDEIVELFQHQNFDNSVYSSCSLLQEVAMLGSERPEPSSIYLQKIISKLRRKTDTGDGNPKGKTLSRNVLISVVAILHYWQFHGTPPDPIARTLVLDICHFLFPGAVRSVPQSSSLEDLIVVNKDLDSLTVCDFLRCGHVLIEYLLKTNPKDTKTCMKLVTQFLGASSMRISPLIVNSEKSTHDILLVATRTEEAIIHILVGEDTTLVDEIFDPTLSLILKEHLSKNPVEGLAGWPWALLKLATFGPHQVVEKAREITQSLIGNPVPMLCPVTKNQGEMRFPTHVVDIVRDNLWSVLKQLFQKLSQDSAQLLFTALSNIFPSPVDYTASMLLPDTSSISKSKRKILRELVRSLREYKMKGADRECGVLPNPHSIPSQLHQCLERIINLDLDSTYQSHLQKVTTAMLSVSIKHLRFVRRLSEIDIDNRPLLFQLYVLWIRVLNCTTFNWSESNKDHHTIPYNCQFQLGSLGGHVALQYLADCWRHCFEPKSLISLLIKIHTFSKKTTEYEDIMGQLLVAVINTDEDVLLSLDLYKKCDIINILAKVGNLQHLCTVATNVLRNDSSLEILGCLGEAFGHMYNKIKSASTDMTNSESDTLLHSQRLIDVCQSILQDMLTRSMELSQALPNLSLPQRLSFRLSLLHKVELNMNVQEWAPIVCDIGCSAVEQFLTILQNYYTVNFIDSLQQCVDIGTLWGEYRKQLPSTASILDVPLFNKMVPVLIRKEEEKVFEKMRRNPKNVEKAMLLLAKAFHPLQLEAEYRRFATEVASMCNCDVRHAVEESFVQTPLSQIDIEKPLPVELEDFEDYDDYDMYTHAGIRDIVSLDSS